MLDPFLEHNIVILIASIFYMESHIRSVINGSHPANKYWNKVLTAVQEVSARYKPLRHYSRRLAAELLLDINDDEARELVSIGPAPGSNKEVTHTHCLVVEEAEPHSPQGRRRQGHTTFHGIRRYVP